MDQSSTIAKMLRAGGTWAVVGCSPDPSRASHRVAAFLQRNGFRIVPVRPGVEEILGERCFDHLRSIPADVAIDVVDVFRRAGQAGVHVDEAIERPATGVWLQLGVIDDAAAARGRAAGLDVVMDRCPMIELPRL